MQTSRSCDTDDFPSCEVYTPGAAAICPVHGIPNDLDPHVAGRLKGQANTTRWFVTAGGMYSLSTGIINFALLNTICNMHKPFVISRAGILLILLRYTDYVM